MGLIVISLSSLPLPLSQFVDPLQAIGVKGTKVAFVADNVAYANTEVPLLLHKHKHIFFVFLHRDAFTYTYLSPPPFPITFLLSPSLSHAHSHFLSLSLSLFLSFSLLLFLSLTHTLSFTHLDVIFSCAPFHGTKPLPA